MDFHNGSLFLSSHALGVHVDVIFHRLFTAYSSQILENLVNLEEASKEEIDDLAGSYDDIAQSANVTGDMQTALVFYRKALDVSLRRIENVVSYLNLVLPDDTDEGVRLLKSTDVIINGSNFTYLTALLVSDLSL